MPPTTSSARVVQDSTAKKQFLTIRYFSNHVCVLSMKFQNHEQVIRYKKRSKSRNPEKNRLPGVALPALRQRAREQVPNPCCRAGDHQFAKSQEIGPVPATQTKSSGSRCFILRKRENLARCVSFEGMTRGGPAVCASPSACVKKRTKKHSATSAPLKNRSAPRYR